MGIRKYLDPGDTENKSKHAVAAAAALEEKARVRAAGEDRSCNSTAGAATRGDANPEPALTAWEKPRLGALSCAPGRPTEPETESRFLPPDAASVSLRKIMSNQTK